MFKRIFLSESPVFRTREQMTAALFGSFTYNEFLVTPPRIYGEVIQRVAGLWVTDRVTPTSRGVIQMFCLMQQVLWPSWNVLIYNFEATTGKYLGIETNREGHGIYPSWWYLGQVYQSLDGSLWAKTDVATIYRIDPVTYQSTGETYPASHFSQIGYFGPILVDKGRNLLLNGENRYLTIYNLTTGALLGRVELSGNPQQILPENDQRCYVVCENQLFNVVDYINLTVLSTFKSPTPGQGYFAYDRVYRRLLDASNPTVDTTGQSTLTISGYYPVPLLTGIGSPIPLKAPRENRTVPVLVQTFGDVGEPVSGQVLTASVSGSLTLAPKIPITDNVGEAVFSVTGSAAGAGTISVSAELPATS